MRKILFGVVITLIVLFFFNFCGDKKENKILLQESSELIQEQIENVGKLVVTEGHFSEVFNFQNSKTLFGEYITSDKKALVIVNADVSVVYDLSKIDYKIDEASKTLKIIIFQMKKLKSILILNIMMFKQIFLIRLNLKIIML